MKNLGFNSSVLRGLSKVLGYTFLLSVNNIAFSMQNSKGFDPATIAVGGTSTLTITITNNDGANATGLEIHDMLPDGVTIASSTLTTSNCGGLTGTLTVGGSNIDLTGGSVIFADPNITCTIKVIVTSNTPGTHTNHLLPGEEGPPPSGGSFYFVGAGLTFEPGDEKSADLTVTAAPVQERPTISKRFFPNDVDDCGCSELVITLLNPASTAATLTAAFRDRFPPDLKTVGRGRTTCTGGRLLVGESSITLQAGAVIPAKSFCTISIDVASHCNGEFTNIIRSGALQTSNGSNLLGTSARVNFCCERDEDATVEREQCLAENSTDEDEEMSLVESIR